MSHERIFTLPGMTLAAQEWGEPGGEPILALHGWLDNSATFNALAPLLPGTHIVALDLAGHGRSGHRAGVGPYNIWEDVSELFEVADQLGWDRFSLLGHSRGGIIGMIAAGTFPERITRLALIEALWPEVHQPQAAPRQLARSILEMSALRNKPLSVYRDLTRAAKARARGMFPLSIDAARALTERGTKAVDGGYSWSTDQRLLAPSAVKLTEDYIEAFLTSATADMAMILGRDGIPRLFSHYREALQRFPDRLNWIELPGGHHLHLESQAPQVAECLRRFFNGQALGWNELHQ
ncbi:alpha/beta fold hydrolase [Marinimicrobium sp. LS-A18]|uniref:alpha/beta hydrolase n=1 Tax=Marinimicrobium sp. LS-A18 TaxID=1381596 RepID=UPI0004639151|nr:alpha/beta hydrolase [Marinimicrobium sp. LS-A18]